MDDIDPKRPGVVFLGDHSPQVDYAVGKLKGLRFLDREYRSDGILSQQVLAALGDMRESFTGDPNDITQINPAVLDMLGTRRCGMSQRHFKSARARALTVPEVGWPSRTVRFAIGSLFLMSDFVSESEAADAIRVAARQWNDSCGIDFVETDLGDQHDIAISAIDVEPAHHTVGNVIAHADYPGVNNLYDEPLQLHFNGNDVWSIDATPSAYDIVRVAMHELGHCLGLFHYPGTIMNETISLGDDSQEIESEISDRIDSLYS